MQIQFSKMHGLGNDFMVIDRVSQDVHLTPDTIQHMADRHTGIGFDQLLCVEPPTDPDSDFRYRIYNADGSEAEQCGNGARCFAKFVVEKHLSSKTELRLQTNTGAIVTHLREDGTVEVEMGVPTTVPDQIPFVTDHAAISYPITIGNESVEVVPISVGNPHAVIFVDSINDAPVGRLGPILMHHERFPRGVNVGFCQVIDSGFARLRVYERGVGETRACGTGACAAVVAGVLTGRFGERVKISLPGGKVKISWAGAGHPVYLLGPACFVYEGHIEL
ncbi:MAG: diaminopimelate epimerase [Proteobacteria bacterium]|nr:diaminopimelate epimerase [Pseudomonadota bacterium]